MGGKTESKSKNARLGLKTRLYKIDHHIRAVAPKDKNVSPKAALIIATAMDFFLEKLMTDLAVQTENGKHQLTPVAIANVIGNRKSPYFKVFPSRIGGVYVDQKE